MTDQTTRPLPTFDEVRDCGHTTQQHRHLDATRELAADLEHARAERDQARAATAAAEQEHGEALTVITDAWAALNAAGLAGPGSPADHIRQLAEQRDTARHLVDVRTAALQRRTGQRDQLLADLTDAGNEVDLLTADRDRLRRTLAAARDGVELAVGALSSVDGTPAQTAPERPDSADGGTGKGDGENGAHRGAEGDDWLDAAMETADSILIDNRDRIWRPAPDGTYHRHPFGNRTRASLDAQYGPTQAAMVIYLDGPGHVCDPIECACELSPADAPPLGSGPARAQGSPDRVAQATRWIAAAGIPIIDRDVRAWLDRLGVPVPVGIWPLMTEIRRAVIAAGDAGYAAGRAQDGRAQGSLTRCCAHPGCPRTYQADVGPQDRGWVRLRGLTVLCPDHAGPETLTEPTPAEVAEHGPTVARILGDVRAGRPANPDRVHP